MPRYTITADVTVSLVMSIEAESVEDARSIFDGEIAMTASLVDIPTDKWDVEDDAIAEIARLRIEEE